MTRYVLSLPGDIFTLTLTILDLVLLQYFFTIFVFFSETILSCFHEGSTSLPGPPRSVFVLFSNIINIITKISNIIIALDISNSLDVDDVAIQGGESPASGPQQCSCDVRTIKLEIDHDIHFDGDVKTIKLETEHDIHLNGDVRSMKLEIDDNDREYMQNFVVRAMKLEIAHDIQRIRH